jgi:hypothetical protein
MRASGKPVFVFIIFKFYFCHKLIHVIGSPYQQYLLNNRIHCWDGSIKPE